MAEESPRPASAPTGAVFLSYASQDGDAAARICAALRAAGIEVWFDQSELRGGDLGIGANAAASRRTIVAAEAEIARVGADSYTLRATLALPNSSGLT
jgi:hypothetical protein